MQRCDTILRRRYDPKLTPIVVWYYQYFIHEYSLLTWYIQKAGTRPRRKHQPIRPAKLLPKTSHTVSQTADHDPFPYLSNLVSAAGSPDSLILGDLELMHNFTATTWETLPQGYKRQEVWQLEVPRLALEHEAVMHQLLAISAYHLAYLQPARRTEFLIRASQHQNLAIGGLRSILPDITQSNCHATFAIASLLSIGAFASSSDALAQANQPDVDTMLEVFLLIRGMHHILKNYENVIADGPIGKILRFNACQSDSAQLQKIVQDLQTRAANWEENGNDEVRRDCKESAALLVDWIKYATVSADDPELRVTMTWPLELSESFMTLLREREPLAMGILLVYCKVVEAAGVRNWYLSGWGTSVAASLV